MGESLPTRNLSTPLNTSTCVVSMHVLFPFTLLLLDGVVLPATCVNPVLTLVRACHCTAGGEAQAAKRARTDQQQ